MTIRRVAFLTCDLCGRKSVNGRDDMDACRAATKLGWAIIRMDFYGNECHVCPECSEGKTHEQVAESVLSKGKEGKE